MIQLSRISKKYPIGKRQPYYSLRDSLTQLLTKPLTSSSQEFWALRDLSFKISQGETVGIIGKNGAGKSTLLKLLSRITPPTTGRIELWGRAASMLEVGTGFHPELTGRENIYLNGSILGMTRSEINRKFSQIVEFSEISQFLDTPVKHYSSGMYMRLAFSVAAHLESEILIVDEVLAVGDAQFQKKCLGKMGEVSHHQGKTVLFVSHNLTAIKSLCSRVILLDQGRLVADGKPEAVISRYLKAPSASKIHRFHSDPHKSVQFIEARTLNSTGISTNQFECDEDILLSFKIRINKPVTGLYGYLTINTVDGAVVWESDSGDNGKKTMENLQVGIHTFHIQIPHRHLAPGKYNIYLNFTDYFGQESNIDSPGIVNSFVLSDNHTIRGNRRNGYFSSLLTWEKVNKKYDFNSAE